MYIVSKLYGGGIGLLEIITLHFNVTLHNQYRLHNYKDYTSWSIYVNSISDVL